MTNLRYLFFNGIVVLLQKSGNSSINSKSGSDSVSGLLNIYTFAT